MGLHKDEILDGLSRVGNVAQFVAFRQISGRPAQSYSCVAGREANHKYINIEEAISELIERSSERSVNIRSFSPDDPKSKEFIYGLSSVVDTVSLANRLCDSGLDVIINETIDVSDGGVSGVAHGQTMEFAPDDTPRCVEMPGVASMNRGIALQLLKTVYGFLPDIPNTKARIEFSIHPRPRGNRHSHTVLWELDDDAPESNVPVTKWPNRFSRHIGDKAFGLLIAALSGHQVPKTLVIGRRVAPFEFGLDTGSAEKWIRTCPFVPEPGLFSTQKGWTDPFSLLEKEDPEGIHIASIISQSAVLANYSGAAIVQNNGNLVIEGIRGEGDSFMLGRVGPEGLPQSILGDIHLQYQQLSNLLGPVRFEWVHDGHGIWIVQLHVGDTESHGQTIVPGESERWLEFDVSNGLEELRRIYKSLPANVGVVLVGDVGLTSHIADVARRARRPTKLAPTTSS